MSKTIVFDGAADYVRDSHNLLKWIQRQLEPYRNIVKVIDLNTSWRNGLALAMGSHCTDRRTTTLW